MEKTICYACEQSCDTPCAAFIELHNIYNETRKKEKRQLIRNLRKQLGIVDAETAPDLANMARQIIRKLPELRFIQNADINIGYVRSYERKIKNGKCVYADCRKVNKVYGAYLPYDFIITFYDLNAGILSENQQKVLMWHELKHVGIGERGLTVVPHDIEDFFSITDEHSTRWIELGADIPNILG